MPYPAPAVPGYVDKSTVITAAEMNWLDQQARSAVSLLSFAGADPTGTTDSTAALTAALASLSPGGALRIPAGTWKIWRGNGGPIADNILADNITVFGDGAATVIVGYNALGTTPPADPGNEYYNVFQATSRSGITIRDMSFQGYCTPVSFFSCSDIEIRNLQDNALISNGYLRDKSIYLYKCSGVRVFGGQLINHNFGIYLSGDGTTQTSRVKIIGVTFKHTAAAGSYVSLFPVGVYLYFADATQIVACSFERIYSSTPSGNQGTGIGYGVYDGDGTCGDILVSSCSFNYPALSTMRAIGVLTSSARTFTVSGCTFFVASGAQVQFGILGQINAPVSPSWSFTHNEFYWVEAAFRSAMISVQPGGSTTTQAPAVFVSGNQLRGGYWGYYSVYTGNAVQSIVNNYMSGQAGNQIQLDGEATRPYMFPHISGNTLGQCQLSSIVLNSYTLGAHIVDNVILDGNQSNTASTAAIVCATYSYVGHYAGNTIGNTPRGGGLFAYALDQGGNEVDRIFKTITGSNTLLGVGDRSSTLYDNTPPANSAFDMALHDFISNSAPVSGSAPGWYCVFRLATTLTGDASSASKILNVTSNTGVQAGDVLLLVKHADPYSTGDYANVLNWHVDVVNSTGAGTITVNNGIDPGDGTYSSATSIVRVYRTKAAASIA